MTQIRERRASTRTIVRAAMIIKDVPPRLTRAPFEQHEAAKYSRGTPRKQVDQGAINNLRSISSLERVSSGR